MDPMRYRSVSTEVKDWIASPPCNNYLGIPPGEKSSQPRQHPVSGRFLKASPKSEGESYQQMMVTMVFLNLIDKAFQEIILLIPHNIPGPRKMSRNIARALVPEQGPEAAAIVNLNSEETRPLGEKNNVVCWGMLGESHGIHTHTHTPFFCFLGGGLCI